MKYGAKAKLKEQKKQECLGVRHYIKKKWSEEDYSFRRRAKREFKKYCEKNKTENRKFYLLEN